MTIADRWLLPDGIEEVLPPQAWQVETMRRTLLDLYASWGYELVIPPHIEFLESLSAGAGNDLELQTFKITDQLTGRMMGLRADTTPAVARMDAHTLNRTAPARLCYAGSVFHTRPASLAASRTPIQVGVELYGHAGVASDIEVISLMLETLAAVGIDNPHVDLGHVDIFRQLTSAASLNSVQEAELFDALQRKANPEIQKYLADWAVAPSIGRMLTELSRLSGGREILGDARTMMADAPASVIEAIDTLEMIADHLSEGYPQVELYFDLSELRGYNYHTGVVFSAYLPEEGQAIAKGGRYDGIGEVFGRARPATGFSTDLKALMRLGNGEPEAVRGILAPVDADKTVVRHLREQGEKVIYSLPGQTESARDIGCDRELKLTDGSWQVVPVG